MARKTKAQIAAEQVAAREVCLIAALRWTEPAPARDVPPPDGLGSYNRLSTGYTFNVHTRSTSEACSSSVSHAIGRTDRADSQRPISLYSTRLLALRALRAAMEREYAEALLRIDDQIKKEGE